MKKKLAIAGSIAATLTMGASANSGGMQRGPMMTRGPMMMGGMVKCYGHKDIPLGKNACGGLDGKASCAGQFKDEHDRPLYWMMTHSEEKCHEGGGLTAKEAMKKKAEIIRQVEESKKK